MGVIFLVIVGGILGWLAAIIMRAESLRETLVNVGVGIVGALLAGLVINPLLGAGDLTSGGYSVDALLASLLGAVVLLGAVNLLRRGDFR